MGGGESIYEKLIDKELYSIPKRIMKEKKKLRRVSNEEEVKEEQRSR